MKWQSTLSFLVLAACDGTHADDALVSTSPTASNRNLDVVPTGTTCDSTGSSDDTPFAPAAGIAGSTAIAAESPQIVGWATRVVNVDYGEGVDAQWKTPERALGPAQGTSTDVVSLGEGGIITLEFEEPIADHPGFDLCVFENSFSDTFLEFAYVEVASDSNAFVRFTARSRVPAAISAYGTTDPTLVDGLAGKYRQGYCTPFDLAQLANRIEVTTGALDLTRVSYVRIRDVIGDGRNLDCASSPVYDPYPTSGGAGFDLDAIAAIAPAPVQ